MSTPLQSGQIWPPVGGGLGGSLPLGIREGDVLAWKTMGGNAWIPARFVTDASGDPLADSAGDLILVEDS